ncbi:OLC1v1014837C1 [Oldenlandia corymbosa var. corymbosa]|uniref:OLC1v1014837C1 n=1 Tax=Oldenlandia corymbosa var. corymbosa TaxID=529605 RepID=A0AAV1E5I4_OLDCO|nr:OLC1v1014837C1 [Oldenlandia corymbosa var. corymbosa]
MLICQISKRISRTMISQLNNLVYYPPCFEAALPLRCPPSFRSTTVRIQCFRHPGSPSTNPKVSIPESQKTVSVVPVCKISRVARNDAQAALFDYLHYTRGFTYVDAEHICKNSPNFIQDLVAKVENEPDVSRALSKLFRYHPINEFEPFLESLGLKPSEVSSLLPSNLMFLEDGDMLLHNFHVLCDYGIPRSEIGKIYKEAIEIFSYGFGVLSTKVMAYENLGLSRPTVIKLVTCCPSILVGDLDKELVEILDKLIGLGFDRDWIGGYMSSKNTYCWSRMLATIGFLVEVGYDEGQIEKLIRKNPAILFEGSGRQMYILIGCFLKLGLKMKEVYPLFVENPEILSPKCTENIWKALHLLFEVGLETENIAKIVSSHIQILASHALIGPNTVLKKFGGDRQKLLKAVKGDPSKFFTLASKSNVSSVEQLNAKNPGLLLEKTTFLVKLGYVENSDEMAKALKKFRGRGDQLQERFDCLVEAGLDSNVVSDMIKQAPTAINQSKDVLEKKIDFLKSSGYPLESLASFPSYLCYDIERIQRRFSMYTWLLEKGAAKPMLSLSTLLACSDARFMKYYVDVHPEGPVKWESLKGQ